MRGGSHAEQRKLDVQKCCCLDKKCDFYPVLFAFCNHKSEGCWPGLFVARHLAWLRTDYISVVSAQRTSGIYASYIFFY